MKSDSSGVFKALADPHRREILRLLSSRELTVGQIVEKFSISGPSISRHLSILRNAGLVVERREANKIFYSIVEERLAISVGSYLSAICPAQIVLRKSDPTRGSSTKKPKKKV